ncbi:MAG: hypothetical protein ACI86X_000279 [Moritella sp.]|jgi:hypothetical protein
MNKVFTTFLITSLVVSQTALAEMMVMEEEVLAEPEAITLATSEDPQTNKLSGLIGESNMANAHLVARTMLKLLLENPTQADAIIASTLDLLPTDASVIVKLIATEHPEYLAPVLAQTLQNNPEQLSTILVAASKAQPTQSALITQTALAVQPEELNTIVTMLVKTTPEQTPAIMSAAILAQPQQTAGIVALTLALAPPAATEQILTAALDAAPVEQLPNIARVAQDNNIDAQILVTAALASGRDIGDVLPAPATGPSTEQLLLAFIAPTQVQEIIATPGSITVVSAGSGSGGTTVSPN